MSEQNNLNTVKGCQKGGGGKRQSSPFISVVAERKNFLSTLSMQLLRDYIDNAEMSNSYCPPAVAGLPFPRP